ncbi:DUF5671 domain-containing protein [Arthrobacter sp. LAR12-1-1.1]|uniref:DUF5671 domain-containing protein n=1 Tax=Arthrobacter sp. LAR12-1-1.1 TaxID=3135215 RepID=UPI0034128CAA
MSAQRTVRRLITYALLFALVVTAAVGLGGLLGRLLVAGTELASDDVSGLARSLAFALIGGPLAAILWWAVWRRLEDPEERSAVGWGLYVAGAYLLALLIASTNVLNTLSALIGGDGPGWRLSFAASLVWAAVWVWHRWMWRHPRKGPTALADVPTVLGSVLGLVLAVGGAVSALSTLLDAALRGAATEASVGKQWWVSALQSLVWAAGGTGIWWWHWKHDGGRKLRTGLAEVALITVGVLGAGVLTLAGSGVALFVVLRLLFDRTEPLVLLLEPLAPAVAAAAIGSLVWVYHGNIARRRSDATVQGGRLVTSGVALVATASGIGVIVNSVLAMTSTPLAGAGARTLLLAGVSSLLVGGPVWWLAWRPLEPVAVAGAGLNARRIYLVAVFGLSAVVAVVTLLVIGLRMFEFFLSDVSGGSLIEQIRAPLGLLVATGLVFGYHFAVWRQDRTVLAASGLAAAGPVRPRTIHRVILVAGSDPEPLRRVIDEVTGAGVTVWKRADGSAVGVAGGEERRAGGTQEEQLAAALEGVAAARVLVVADQHGGIDVIPLQG